MGNCLKGERNDSDLNLLSEEEQPDNNEQPSISPSPSNNAVVDVDNIPIFHPSPGVSRTMDQLTEDEQIRIAKRLGLIDYLPTRIYKEEDVNEKLIECAICMSDYAQDEVLRVLPCMHAYHKECIDDWLHRSFTCPSCLQPVDSALFASFNG